VSFGRRRNIHLKWLGRCRTGLGLKSQYDRALAGWCAVRDKPEVISVPRRIAFAVDGEIFYTLQEAQVIVESWRRHYNTIRTHTSLNYRPPVLCKFVGA